MNLITFLLYIFNDFTFFGSPVLALIWVIIENRKLAKGQSTEEPFSVITKIIVGLLCLVDPIVTGPIFYYGLRKKFPKKARYANWTSIILFIIELAAMFYFFHIPFYLPSETPPLN
jgi:hypothetical protein